MGLSFELHVWKQLELVVVSLHDGPVRYLAAEPAQRRAGLVLVAGAAHICGPPTHTLGAAYRAPHRNSSTDLIRIRHLFEGHRQHVALPIEFDDRDRLANAMPDQERSNVPVEVVPFLRFPLGNLVPSLVPSVLVGCHLPVLPQAPIGHRSTITGIMRSARNMADRF